jgi:hypothetical protein
MGEAMRAVGVLAFVLAGLVLVLTPLISDHIRQETAARLLERRADLKEVNLGPGMSEEYRWACWVGGAILLLIGAMFGAESAWASRGSEDGGTPVGRA